MDHLNTKLKFLVPLSISLILFEIWHLQNFILIFSKGRNFTSGDNSPPKNMRLLFFHEESIHEVSRRYLIPSYKISPPCLSKGRKLTRGDNSGKTKIMRRLFFHEESIHEVSRRYLEHTHTHTQTHTHTHTHTYIHTHTQTYIHTDRQAETNMSPTFSKLGA